MDSYEIGRAIRTAREVAGLPVKEVAARAGISQSWWRQLELGYEVKNGERKPINIKTERLARVAQAVGLPVAEFLAKAGRTESPPQPEHYTAAPAAPLDTAGLNRDDLVRVQAFIDGLKAGKA